MSKYVETAEILWGTRLELLREKEGKIGGSFHLLLLGGLVAVAQMATVGEVQSHESSMRRHEGLVDLQVGGTATQGLNVDTPLLRVDVEGLESSLLAEQLNLVDVLVAAVVPGAGVALGVLVGHGRAQGVEDGARGDILGSDQDDGFSLALDLEFLSSVHGQWQSRIRGWQGTAP